MFDLVEGGEMRTSIKIQRWIPCAAAVAVALLPGCTKMKTALGLQGPAGQDQAGAFSAPATQPMHSADSSHGDTLFDNPDLFAPKTPVVNVFGELDGKAPHGTPAGEANFQQHTYLEEGFDADVAVSPDGKNLLYASTRHNEHPDIYLQRIDGLSVTQLTSDNADDSYPTFSPDGKQIAFCSTRGGSWDIYLMDADGRNASQVTSAPSQELHPSFSPDGRKLVYCSTGNRSAQWELWTVDLVTGEKRMIGFGLFPVWSPEKGKNQIAFQRARQRGSRWFSLWTLDLIDGEARRVTEVAASSNAAIVSPVWNPDGKRLAFSTIVNPAFSKEGRPRGQQDIWTISADGSNRKRITDGTGLNLSPAWSADGRIYFISDRGGAECVWSAQPQTGNSQMAGTGEELKK